MKILKVLMLLITVVSLSACSQGKTDDQVKELMAGFIKYDDPTYNVSIQYPEDWIMSEETYGALAGFLSPYESDTDFFQENVNIAAQETGGEKINLKEYADYTVEQIKGLYSNVESSSKASTLDGNDAYEVYYSFEELGMELKTLQVFTVKNDVLYVVTYVAQGDKYDKYMDTVNKMIDSVDIK